MKLFGFILLLLMSFFQKSYCQTEVWRQLWVFSRFENISEEKITRWQRQLEKHSRKILQKRFRFKNENAFLRYLFNFLHHKYLKTYKKNATWHHIFQEHTYNCVGGVALFAYFLEKSGFSYQIYESNHHVFLGLFNSQGESILIETTSFFSNGLQVFRSSLPAISNFESLSTISLENLIGIFYYNEAVISYLQENFLQAIIMANRAYQFYPCSRHRELFFLCKEKITKHTTYKVDSPK